MRRPRPTRPIARRLVGVITSLAAASFITRTAVLGLLTLVISGAVHALAQPVADSPDQATDLVQSIVDGQAKLDQVPIGFIDDMGYVPVPTSPGLLNPRGGCSTPGEVGPEDFYDACKTHDLGYDILRYAERHGGRLSAKARLELDWKLYGDLLETCETATCSLTATIYYGAISANSIRQGYKAPHAEPATPWMALVAAVFGLSAAGGLPILRSNIPDTDRSGRCRTHEEPRLLTSFETGPTSPSLCVSGSDITSPSLSIYGSADQWERGANRNRHASGQPFPRWHRD